MIVNVIVIWQGVLINRVFAAKDYAFSKVKKIIVSASPNYSIAKHSFVYQTHRNQPQIAEITTSKIEALTRKLAAILYG